MEKNASLADEHTKKAALMGFARAAMKFGKTWEQFCKNQDFTEAEAREWQNRNLRAARAGYASEQYNLGIIYQHGFGVEKNLATARECSYTDILPCCLKFFSDCIPGEARMS